MPKETQQISKFTQQPFNFHKKEKSRAYAIVRSKPVCICGNRRRNHVYTRLWVKNSRIGRKVHKNKANRQGETNFTPIRLYQAYIPPDPTQKQERQSNSNTLNAEKSTPKGQLLGTPQRNRQSCYGEKFLWLGVPQQTARLQNTIFPNMQ